MTIFRKQTRLKKGVIVVHIIKIKVIDLNWLVKKCLFYFHLRQTTAFTANNYKKNTGPRRETKLD